MKNSIFSQAQNFLIAIIVGAIFDFLGGTLLGPRNIDQQAKGFNGFSSETNFILLKIE